MGEAAVDLAGASREELLAVIAAQAATIATLHRRLSELEGRVGASGGKGVPGTKPLAGQRSKASGRPREQRDRGYARVRMSPTATVSHAAAICPDCGTRLVGGWVKRTREVIDLPVAPVTVTAHQIVARTCPRCRRPVLPADPLAGVVHGRQRFGVRVVSMIATLREALRLPVGTIQRLLHQVYALRLSVGAITAASDRVAAAGQRALSAIRDRI